MFDSVAFNVVIGLVFIYLLYSLLATVIAELIATKLGLRARNLKEAIDRMLNDEKQMNVFQRLWDSLKLMKNPKNKIVNNFYNHPEIKYLGSSGIFKLPSSFKAVSFSKTLLHLLNNGGAIEKQNITEAIKNIESTLTNDAPAVLGKETAQYVLSLWIDAEKDVVKFKQQLEAWFDRTMEQALEWYKRKMRIVLLIIGFMIAWIFNADTMVIVKKLSKDKDARDKVVSLATAYVQNNKTALDTAKIGTADIQTYNQRLDSLLAVKKDLETDIHNATSMLGTGSWLPDSIEVKTDSAKKKTSYIPEIEQDLLPADSLKKVTPAGFVKTENLKWTYFFNSFAKHLWGFLITALAISLGAPFWFDMLNKIMRLRTSAKHETDSSNTTSDNRVLPSGTNNSANTTPPAQTNTPDQNEKEADEKDKTE